LNIPKNTPEINAIGLHEEKDNPWKPPPVGKLISPSETPNMESLTTQKTPLEDTMDRLLRNLYEGISNLRFRLDIEDNLFQQSSKGHKPVLPTFSTWKSMDYAYYYNILKNKGPAKRKVTFGQTITS